MDILSGWKITWNPGGGSPLVLVDFDDRLLAASGLPYGRPWPQGTSDLAPYRPDMGGGDNAVGLNVIKTGDRFIQYVRKTANSNIWTAASFNGWDWSDYTDNNIPGGRNSLQFTKFSDRYVAFVTAGDNLSRYPLMACYSPDGITWSGSNVDLIRDMPAPSSSQYTGTAKSGAWGYPRARWA